jgi:hypothetical protein
MRNTGFSLCGFRSCKDPTPHGLEGLREGICAGFQSEARNLLSSKTQKKQIPRAKTALRNSTLRVFSGAREAFDTKGKKIHVRKNAG